MSSSKKTILLGLGVSLIGVLVALIGVEIIVRNFLLTKSSPQQKNDRPISYYLPPGTESFKEFAYQAKKPANTFRIAVVGDSFSFGPRMQFDDTFSKRLERILNLRKGGPKVEVINYGVSGFATVHEANMVSRALHEGADLVLLQITLNDPEPIPFTGRKDPAAAPTWIESISSWWKTLGFVLTRLENSRSPRNLRKYYFDIFENQKNWSGFTGALEKINDRTSSAKVPLAVVIFPLFDLGINANYPFQELHQKIQGQLGRLSVPYLDLTATYQGLSSERLEVLPGIDAHPNEIAHRIAADALYRWLFKEQLIPATLKVERRAKSRQNIPSDLTTE